MQVKKNGYDFWRNEDIINTAEKKILMLALSTGVLFVVSGLALNFQLIGSRKFQAALVDYFLCKAIGGQECSKQQLEKHSFTVLNAVSAALVAICVPFFYLLYIMTIQWTKTTKWMKSKADNLLSVSKCRKYSGHDDYHKY